MIIALILAIYLLSFVLIKSADHMVLGIRHLSRSSGGTFIVSALILAIATSFPELFVGITSAVQGTPTLSFGNILGANIANISLVAGIAALTVGRVKVHGQFLKRDVAIALIAGILPLILIMDGQISRVEGLALLCFYLAYALSFFKIRFAEIAKEIEERTFVHRFMRKVTHINGGKTQEWGRLFISIVVLLVSANLIVNVAQRLSLALSIPVFLVGLVILSLGTTLPELGFSLRSLEDKEPTMFFGNLLGSIICNSTLILGLVAVISPIKVVAVGQYTVAAIAFVAIFSTFWFFIRSKLTLERWEAAVLLIMYLVFVVVEFF